MEALENKDTLEAQPTEDEKLSKSINEMVAEAFPETLKKAADTSKDARTTADAAVKKAPKSENDKSRGAGRPKEISDVPNVDTDGARAKDYDSAITEREGKEEENKEAKKQAKEGKPAEGAKPKAPKMRPFKKGEELEDDEHFKKSYARFLAFEEVSKSEVLEVAEEEVVEEEVITISKSVFDKLSKSAPVAEEPKEEISKAAELVKVAVAEETSALRKSIDSLISANQEQAALLKSIGSKPVPAKAVVGVDALEKSAAPNAEMGSGTFSKGEKAEAAFKLAKSGKLSIDAAIELDTSGTLADPAQRALVEAYLLGDKV